LQREFLQWWQERASSLSIALIVLKRTDRMVKIGFAGYPKSLYAILDDSGRTVFIDHASTLWDSLIWFDVAPRRTERGYVNNLYHEGDSPSYENRKAMWRAEVFEPFGEWINVDLANASGVALYETAHGSTWAELVRSVESTDGDEAYHGFFQFPAIGGVYGGHARRKSNMPLDSRLDASA
jgi:hypothetical protein